MLNNKNDARSEEEARRRFTDDLAAFFAGYGLKATLGRVLAFLMMRAEPASLDEIAEALGISKSGVSTAAQMLETWGMARRTTQPGSKRVLVEANALADALLTNGLPQVHRFRDTLRAGVDVAPAGLPKRRIEGLARMLDIYLEVVESAVGRFREELS